MAKYLVYEKSTGEIWRELDQYIVEEDGAIFGGLNGVNTIRYPKGVNPAVMEIAEEVFSIICTNFAKYLIKDGSIVENPDYIDPGENIEALNKRTGTLEHEVSELSTTTDERIAAIEDALCEMDKG